MNKLLTVLYVLYFISYMMGCKADGKSIAINSNNGDGLGVEFSTSY